MHASKYKKRFLEGKRSLVSGFALPIGLSFSFLVASYHERNDRRAEGHQVKLESQEIWVLFLVSTDFLAILGHVSHDKL